MSLVRVRRAAQITLPRDIRLAAKLEEGNYLKAEMTERGIVLRPVSVAARKPAASAEILAVAKDVRREMAAVRREAGSH